MTFYPLAAVIFAWSLVAFDESPASSWGRAAFVVGAWTFACLEALS